MKICFFSDIHGNILAFEAFLHQIENQEIDKLVFGGDVLGYYYGSDKILDYLRQSEIHCLLGNHDKMFLDLVDGKINEEYLVGKYGNSYLNIKQNIKKENEDFLRTLKPYFEEVVDEHKIGFFHGGPDDPIDQRIYPDADFDEIKSLQEYDFAFVGHTHHKLLKKLGRTTLVNPGSLGQQRDGKGCSYVVFDTKSCDVSFYTVQYEVGKLIEEIGEREYNAEMRGRLVGVLLRQNLDFTFSPIRKLDGNILHSFCFINDEVKACHDDLANIINPEIEICKDAFICPYFDCIDKKIYLSMPFLDYMWYFCYAFFVTEEKTQQSLLSNPKNELVDLRISEAGRQVTKALYQCNHILSLQDKTNNSIRQIDWSNGIVAPMNLNFDDETNDFIGKVNSLYVEAITCILLHELGHCFYGHTPNPTTSNEEKKLWETEADNFALEKMIRGTQEEILNYSFGAFLGYLGLLFIGKIKEKIYAPTHPAIHDRFDRVIEKFKEKTNDQKAVKYLYHFASQTILIFLDQKGWKPNSYDAKDDVEGYYRNLLDVLDEYIISE